jgi:hypothetical protein
MSAGANGYFTNCIIADIWKIDNTGGYTVVLDHCLRTNVGTFVVTSENNPIAGPAMFVSPSTGNFRLMLGSPALNSGVFLGLSPDLAGNAVSNPPEVGAYEFGSVWNIGALTVGNLVIGP